MENKGRVPVYTDLAADVVGVAEAETVRTAEAEVGMGEMVQPRTPPPPRRTEKVNRLKGETRFLMSSYTYLALRISNPVGAKLSRWRLGIISFGANWDLRRSYTQCGHCHAGAKLFRSYFGIISFRRQISSTYGFYTT